MSENRQPRRWVKLFKDRFAEAVRTGIKRQTIRPWPKRDEDVPRVGDVVDCRRWSGLPYRSKQVKLCEGVVTSLRGVEIIDGRIHFFHDPATMGDGETVCWVLAPHAASELARADGFASAEEMVAWFRDTHGLPFVGYLVKWAAPDSTLPPSA